MTNEANKTLTEWWETISFDGKELFTVSDTGELRQHAVANLPERIIAQITIQDADAVLQTLLDKYKEASAKVLELETDWVQAEDKLKLAIRVEKLKEHLQQLNALGSIDQLLSTVNNWTHTIDRLTEDNYIIKLRLTETAESLIDSNTWKETTQAFKDITEKWKQSGYLDRKRNDALWARIEIAKNTFFERKRTHHLENEKDLLQNLDLKMELAEKAEMFAHSEKWKETTEVFKQLMEQWKAIGHTIPEKNEELWKRFIAAKNIFFDRKKDHTRHIHHEMEANLAAKTTLVEKTEALQDSTDWVATTQALADIMEEWKNSGRAEAEKADELWNRMKVARDHFFNAKHKHFESIKENLQANYNKKKELLGRAEALQNSNHWHDATEEINRLMEEWKAIGPVPREHSNIIWEAFLAARKTFFKRKDENRERRKDHAERKKHAHLHNAQDLVRKLQTEIREEEERIEDFKNGLQNISPGHKEKELRAHLETLIAEGEEKIKYKRRKLEQTEKELLEFKTKIKSGNTENDSTLPA